MTKNLEQIPDILLFYRNKPLRVGFSGGADSTALLLLLLKWGWQPELLEAVHFEHGLRGEASRQDAAWCQEFCRKHKIKFTLVELDLLKKTAAGSIEDIARQARLSWYNTHDPELPVVLAHHCDDAAETLLLKLARGGNSGALAGLRACKKLGSVTVLRPLLDFAKSDLEEFLRENSVNDWRLDGSNESIDYHRNYLRNKLLKDWCSYHAPVRDGLLRSRESLQCDAEFIEECAQKELAFLGTPLPQVTAVDFWKKLHPALLTRVLPGYVKALQGGKSYEFTRAMFEHFQQSLLLPVSREVRQICLNKDLVFLLKNQSLTMVVNAPANSDAAPFRWNWREVKEVTFGSWRISAELLPGAKQNAGKGVFFFDAALLPEELIFTWRQGGERMAVWGSGHVRRIKHILSGCGRKEVFLLRDESGVIYLLGDVRRSVHAPVSEKTSCTLQIKVKYLDQ